MPAQSLDMPASPRSFLRRRIGETLIARIAALADQGLTGVGNVVVFALLGRHLPLGEFGTIGMMIGIHYFIAGFHRSAVVLPFVTDHPHATDALEARARDSGWWWLGLAGAMALAAALALAGAVIAVAAPASWQWSTAPLMLAALVSPAMLAWEFARRWLYKAGRADVVVLAAFGYAVILCSLAWAAGRSQPTAAAAALAWIAASTLALAISCPVLRPCLSDRATIRDIVAGNRHASSWLAATHIPFAFYGSATIVVVIGAIVGPVAAALFTAARTIINPAMSVVSAIDSIDKPGAARALAQGGIPALRRSVARTRVLIALSTGLYLGAAALFADQLVALFFHDQFPDLAGQVRLLALAFFLFGLNQPSETTLIVLRAGRAMLAVRTITALATVVALFLAKPWGVNGMAIAICVTQALNLVFLAIAERLVAGQAR